MSKSFLICCVLGLFAGACVAAVQVDVLVAYDTTSAAWLAAADRTIPAFATEQVDRANEVLSNSGLSEVFSFRLVGTFAGRFSHDQSKRIDSTLSLATESSDAVWSELRSEREAVGADIVMIIVDKGSSSGMVGHSNAMEPFVSTDNGAFERQWGLDFKVADQWLAWFADRAYGICDIPSADTGNVFVHEIGHIMGAGHSELISPSYDEPGPQLFKYSSAMMYKGSDGSYYATVMGYNATGYGDSANYEVLPCFSSPELTNAATGEPLGDATHDNVETLKKTASVVAAFRNSTVSPVTPDTPSSPSDTPSSPSDTPSSPVIPSVVGSFASKTTAYGALQDAYGPVGIATFIVSPTKNGVSKVAGTIIGIDGKKRKVKGGKLQVVSVGGVARVVLDGVSVPGYNGLLHVVIGSDGSLSDGTLGAMSLTNANVGAKDGSALAFCLDERIDAIAGNAVLDSVDYNGRHYPVLPVEGGEMPVSVSGGKWTVVAKAGKLKAKKNGATGVLDIIADVGVDGSKTNLSGLKLSYSKAGTFKGGFTAYALTPGKLLKYKFAVKGIVVDGVGIGEAECKKCNMKVGVTVR